jgi:hypothetical protein
MLNDELLWEYINCFYGYGRWSAPFWFIGMEEACRFEVGAINQRLKVWKESGARSLEDMPIFAPAVGCDWHGDAARLQPTWGKLIRVLLRIKGVEPTHQALLQYQREHLGALGGETCLAEMFPLPAPGLKDWGYGRVSDLPILSSRETYSDALANERIKFLRSKIQEHHPRCVIFYGTTYLRYWRKISTEPLVSKPLLLHGGSERTHYFAMQHPAARHAREYFDDVGSWIRTALPTETC